VIYLCHLDEAGFALTLPTHYSWFPQGQRLRVPYQAPQGRRVNAIGAYISHGVEAGRFGFATYAALPKSRAKQPRPLSEQAAAHGLREEEVGPIDSERFLQFVWSFAGRPAVHSADWVRERPLVIWVDNYSVHTGDRVKEERAAFAAAGINLFFLPSYSPALSTIEPIWQDVKHHDMTKRSYEILGELFSAVDAALTRKAHKLLAACSKSAIPLRAAA